MRPSGVRGQDALAPSGRLGRVSGRERTSLIRDFVWSSHPAQGRRVVGRRNMASVPRQVCGEGPFGAKASCRPTRRKARSVLHMPVHATCAPIGAWAGETPSPQGPRFRAKSLTLQSVTRFVPCELSSPPRTPGRWRAGNMASTFEVPGGEALGGRASRPPTRRKARFVLHMPVHATCAPVGAWAGETPSPQGPRFRAKSLTLQSVTRFVPCELSSPPRTPGRWRAGNMASTFEVPGGEALGGRASRPPTRRKARFVLHMPVHATCAPVGAWEGETPSPQRGPISS